MIPPIYVSTFRSTKDVVPSQPPIPLAWEQIVEKLSDHKEIVEKSEQILWSPTKYFIGSTRANRNVELISCVVMDYDGTDLWEGVKQKLTEYDLIYFAHSTFSNTLEHPCFRVILPLEAPLSSSDWPRMWKRVYGVFGGDKQTCDQARIYYLPSHPFGSEFWIDYSRYN